MKRAVVLACIIVLKQFVDSFLITGISDKLDGKAKGLRLVQEEVTQNTCEDSSPTEPQPEDHQTHSLDMTSLSDFAEIRRSRSFVDKTYFVHDWLFYQPKHWYATAPPGFGKSSLLSMLQHFCNTSASVINGTLQFQNKNDTISHGLFRGTQISDVRDFYKRHFQNYTVVHIDFNPLINTNSFSSYWDNLCSVIAEMVNCFTTLGQHQSLDHTEKKFFELHRGGHKSCFGKFNESLNAGAFLMKVLRKTFKTEIILLVDDYDAILKALIIRDVANSTEIFTSFGKFIEGLVDDKYVDASLFLGSFDLDESLPNLTGRIKHGDVFADEQIAIFFGLTKLEVEKLLTEHGLKKDLRTIDELCGGYELIGSTVRLFNTRFVLTYIRDRGLKPKTAVSTETFELLRGVEKIFIDQWVGRFLTNCIFGKDYAIHLVYSTNYTSLGELKHHFKTTSEFRDDFVCDHCRNLFLVIAQGLGFMTLTLTDKTHARARLANRVGTEILRDFFYKGAYTKRRFRVRALNEMRLIGAFTRLSPSNSSMRALGEAIYSIVKESSILSASYIKSLMYFYARKTAEHYCDEISMEAGVVVQTLQEGKAKSKRGKEKDKEKAQEMIDILLVWRQRKLGVLILAQYARTPTSVVKQIVDRRYFDIFMTHPSYAKLNIKDRILIGISNFERHFGIAFEGEARGKKNAMKFGL